MNYFTLAVNLTRAEAMLVKAEIDCRDPRNDEDFEQERQSDADRELALHDRCEARAFNSGAW